MTDKKFFQARCEKLVKKIKDAHLDGYIILNRANTQYFSGFKGSYSIIVITNKKWLFFTDSRYFLHAKKALSNCFDVELIKNDIKIIRDKIPNINLTHTFGYEDSITIAEYKMLKKIFHGKKFIEAGNIPSQLRMIKDSAEIKLIKKAAQLTDKVFHEILKIIKPGLSEKEIAMFIRRRIEELGGDCEAFSCIVASGENSALPHAHPTNRKLRYGDFVKLDIGAKYDGYCSDMTRTVVLGKASEQQKKIYSIVLTAQTEALSKVKDGITAKLVDGAAREIITKNGYGENFLHGTGHGVGIDIHEPPRIRTNVDDELKNGMVITVEPGIYIDGWGGVRIEDLILVTSKGSKILSKSPKDLIEIK